MRQKTKSILSGAFCLLLSLFLFSEALAQAQKASQPASPPLPAVEMKIKVFEGLREGKVEPVRTVTSSFWRYTLSASIQAEDTSEKEENQIRRVFNLKEVRLLTQDTFSWAKTGTKDFHVFSLDSKEYAIMITWQRALPAERVTCRVEVFEQNKDRKSNLLDSELTLEKNSITAFGFEDASGKPYFLSLKTTAIRPPSYGGVMPDELAMRKLVEDAVQSGVEGVVSGDVKGVVGGVIGGVAGGVAGGVEGGVEGGARGEALPLNTVRAVGGIKPPTLIKRVDPVYPEMARQAGVEGTVILEVTTDIYGRVANIKILKSVPILDQAAIEAVKQWVYEPLIIDGQPKGIIFTVTVTFKLEDEQKEKTEETKTS
ncbi:MAG: energy transducer TonB [Acidobacteriota bacterium]|nr:energy transducer TonB [Acidobacteriota bacterium]